MSGVWQLQRQKEFSQEIEQEPKVDINKSLKSEENVLPTNSQQQQQQSPQTLPARLGTRHRGAQELAKLYTFGKGKCTTVFTQNSFQIYTNFF